MTLRPMPSWPSGMPPICAGFCASCCRCVNRKDRLITANSLLVWQVQASTGIDEVDADLSSGNADVMSTVLVII